MNCLSFYRSALPHNGIDPVPVACEMVQAFQTIVEAQEPTMGAEDFAYMLQARPGAYCFIANGDGSHRELGHGVGPCMLHNPCYDFNDELIPLGATYWVRLAEAWLAKGHA